jgi:hypothetical protein
MRLSFLTAIVLILAGVSGPVQAQGTWNVLTPMASTVWWGGALEWTGGDYLYGLRGFVGTQVEFYRYTIAGDSWTPMANITGSPYWSSGMAWNGGDYIFAIRGNGTSSFYRYSISANSWATMESTPTSGVRHTGDALEWAGGDYIYLLKGNNETTFWRYSISGNSWSSVADVPGTVSFGGCMVWDEGDFLYASGGGSTFARYSISGNNWEILTSIPASLGYGGSMEYDGANQIFVLQGSGSTDFLRYSIDTGIWDTETATPAAVDAGGALVWAGTAVYALQGNTQNGFWRFDPFVGIEDSMAPVLPGALMYPFFPNPSSGIPVARFSLDEAASVELHVFDFSGRLIDSVKGTFVQGDHLVQLNDLSPGIHFCRMTTEGFTATQRFVVTD